MITESDRLMGQLVVQQGLITNDQLQGYLHEVEGGRRPPGSLIGLLTQSGRLTPEMMATLRQRWQEAQSQMAGAPAAAPMPQATPQTSPQAETIISGPGEGKIQKLIAAGVLDTTKAQRLRATLEAWKAQGRDVEISVAVVYLQMATQSQVDQALQSGPSASQSFPQETSNPNGAGADIKAPSNEFMSPVHTADRSQSQYASRRYPSMSPDASASASSAFSPVASSSPQAGGDFDQTISDGPNQQLLDASRRGSGAFSQPDASNPSGMSPVFVDNSNAFSPSASASSPFVPASNNNPAASASPFSSGASPFSSNTPSSPAGFAAASAPSNFANPAFASPSASASSPFASNSPSASASPFSSAPRASDSTGGRSASARRKRASGRQQKATNTTAASKPGQRRRKGGGSRKKGFPVLPVAIGGSIVVIILGSALFFVVLPLRTARGLYDQARQLQEEKQYRPALDKVEGIQSGMLVDEVQEIREELVISLQKQNDEWVAQIDDLIDLAKADPSQLKNAEDLLQTALLNALNEKNKKDLTDRFVDDLAGSRSAIEALALAKEKRFKEALVKVRAINKKDLVGVFDRTEKDIISSLNTYIREYCDEKIVPAAEKGDFEVVKQALAKLQEVYDEAVATDFQEVRNQIDNIRSKNRNKRLAQDLLPRARELRDQKKFEVIYQELRAQDRAVVESIEELKTIFNVADEIIGNRIRLLVKRCCVKAKDQGNYKEAEFEFLDVIKNKIKLNLNEQELAPYKAQIREAASRG